MSPEQASGRKNAVTIATDVHGLGAVLYTILTSQPPFRGDSPLQTLERVREHAPAHEGSHLVVGGDSAEFAPP